jgi:hypothetical protein
MPANYTEANAIEKNSWFRDRVRESISVYANYLLNTAPEDADYDAKVSMAKQLIGTIDSLVIQMVFTLAGDQEVITAGPAIPDVQLQQIVEKTLAKTHPIIPNGPAFAQNQMMGMQIPRPNRQQ